MSQTATKTTAARKSRKAPVKHIPSASDKALLDAQLEKGLTPTPEEQEDQKTNLPVPSKGFSLAQSCGGKPPVQQRSEVTAMLIIGDAAKYAGYQKGVGIHVCVGNKTVVPSDSANPNQLDDVKFVGIGLKPMSFMGKEYFKLNVFFETRGEDESERKVLLATTGLTNPVSKGTLSCLRYLHQNKMLDERITFSVREGNTPNVWLVTCLNSEGKSFYDPTFWPDLRNADDEEEFLKTEVKFFQDHFNGVEHVSVVEALRQPPALAPGDLDAASEESDA